MHRNCYVCHVKLFKKAVSDHYSVDFLADLLSLIISVDNCSFNENDNNPLLIEHDKNNRAYQS